ncbi:MAG: DUF6655 family protein [Pirellulaceae bacterium]|nr:hypothetical protein [Planctomycetales bacterium]
MGSIPIWYIVVLCLLMTAAVGCGTTKSQLATEQLLMSDAVDRAVASIDFEPLRGRRIYLDTQYIQPIQGPSFVNSNYIISSIRQELLAAGAYLQDARDQADVIVEARVGALGTDDHDVTYGIPPNNILNSAASLVTTSTPLPAIPEISLAKRSDKISASKIGLFAYERESRRRIWKSGISVAQSQAKDTWVLGAGPFQSGMIKRDRGFSSRDLLMPDVRRQRENAALADYRKSNNYESDKAMLADGVAEEISLAEHHGVPEGDQATAGPVSVTRSRIKPPKVGKPPQ